jgi:cell division protein FtsB
VSLLLVLLVVVLSYVGPATKYLKAWRLARDTRAEVTRLRHDNERLSAQAKALRRTQRIELEARRFGMARPGEQVYVVRGLPKQR